MKSKINKEIIDYDIEFYKLGRSSNILIKLHAIIKPNKLFSSKISVLEYLKLQDNKKSKLKDKTKYLKNAEVHLENKDSFIKDWSNKNKLYPIHIIYYNKENKKRKNIFKEQMNECNEMLFNFNNSKKEEIKNINNLIKNEQKSNLMEYQNNNYDKNKIQLKIIIIIIKIMKKNII